MRAWPAGDEEVALAAREAALAADGEMRFCDMVCGSEVLSFAQPRAAAAEADAETSLEWPRE